MPGPRLHRAVLLLGVIALISAAGLINRALADFYDTLPPAPLDPAIRYFTETTEDPVAKLNARLAEGDAALSYDDRAGFLVSLLAELDIDISSQVAVFSKTSLQADLIEPANPRTIFFNDQVAVGWMQGGMIEVASLDPRQGVVFYTLFQDPSAGSRLIRNDSCLGCHGADLGIPGMLARTQVVSPAGDPLLIYGGNFADHRTEFDGRWGGYYVTGVPFDPDKDLAAQFLHLGNAVLEDRDNLASMIAPDTLSLTTLEGKFDTAAYLSPYADAAALLVFDHQVHMINLLVRAGWDTRAAMAAVEADSSPENQAELERVLEEGSREVADYMLFVEEAPLPAPVADTSGFRDDFLERGPADNQGRSLRQLDLETRLARYPLSYMIYSEAFDALPDPMREAIYRHLWDVITGENQSAAYAHLDQGARTAILEILRETKSGLPRYWLGIER